MDRREFLKLVVTAVAVLDLPLNEAFKRQAVAAAKTGYTDDLIASMSVVGDHVLIETKRKFTGYEAFEMKRAWEESLGYWKDDARLGVDMREVYFKSLTDEMPPNAIFAFEREDHMTGIGTGEKVYYVPEPSNPAPPGGMNEVFDSVKIQCVMPTSYGVKWSEKNYTDVDEEE